MNTKTLGSITEVSVALACLKHGWSVSVPWGENDKYDLVIDDGIRLQRIQCKSGKMDSNRISASLARVARIDGKATKLGYDPSEVDAFAIYCSENDGVYLISVNDLLNEDGVLQKYVSLRLDSKQIANQYLTRFAVDYKL